MAAVGYLAYYTFIYHISVIVFCSKHLTF